MALEFSAAAPSTVKCCVFTFHYGAKFNVSQIALGEMQINTPWTLAGMFMITSAQENKSQSVILIYENLCIPWKLV